MEKDQLFFYLTPGVAVDRRAKRLCIMRALRSAGCQLLKFLARVGITCSVSTPVMSQSIVVCHIKSKRLTTGWIIGRCVNVVHGPTY
jgi:hypothetical protein